VARNIWIGINMPAPLVGAAAAAAARLVAKKLGSKAAKKAAATKKQAATRAETVRIAKNSVKVKPAAKPKPNKPNEAKMLYKVRDSGGRAYNKATKEYEQSAGRHGNMYEMQDAGREAMFRAPIGRKTSIQAKKLNQAEARKATTPRPSKDVVNSNPWETTVKINSAPKKAAVKKIAAKKKSK
jgi:hypothetical protein